jgi:hypothetical protein
MTAMGEVQVRLAFRRATQAALASGEWISVALSREVPDVAAQASSIGSERAGASMIRADRPMVLIATETQDEVTHPR